MKFSKCICSGLVYVRELVWPILEGEPDKFKEDKIEAFKEKITKIENIDVLGKMYELALKITNEEKERFQTMITKVVTLLSATGIISAIIFGSVQFLFDKDRQFPIRIFCYFCTVYLLSLIYLLKSIKSGLDALAVEKFYALDLDDISIDGSDEKQYLKNVIVKLFEFTQKNYCVTNNKMDSFIIARNFFLRGIMAVGVLGISITIFYVLNLMNFKGN